MNNSNQPIVYPKCRCKEGQESDWEHLNETCIGIRPVIRKSFGIILLILAMTSLYEALSTIIYIDDELFFWGMSVSAFIFAGLSYYLLKICSIKEMTIRCKNCGFETTINFKGKWKVMV